MLERQVAYIHQQLTLAHRKMGNFIARGVLKLIGMDGSKIYNVQGQFLAGETISDLQHPQEFGFASKAKNGAYLIAVFNGGNRDHGQIITIYDPRYTPQDLNDGDSCAYDESNNRVWLKNADGILIKNGNNTITLNSSGITITDTNANTIVMNNAGIYVSAISNNPVTFDSPVIFNEGFTLNGSSVASGTGSINIGGNITSAGQVADANGTMEEMRTTYNSHTHNAPGGTTNAPNQPMG